MIPITSLRDIHAGQPGAVLGGGPSLEKDMKQIPKGAVLIAVNHHALQFVQADYLVFMDPPGRNMTLDEAVKGFLCKMRISPLSDWSDADLSYTNWWQGRFSSHLATWLACWLGCSPVLLCGMDCYQGPRSPDADPRDNAYNTPLSEHLESWREALVKCPYPERIKAVSGPLVEVFGKWSPVPPEHLMKITFVSAETPLTPLTKKN